MLATYPLSVAQFQDRLKISVAAFNVREPRQVDRTASGAILSASLGDAVWQGSFTLPSQSRLAANVAQTDALLSILDRAGSSFLVYDPTRTHPWADPDGTILGAATPSIRTLDSGDARALSLRDLPADYQLTGGDFIGWTYGTDPVRYALHRVVSDVAANVSGDTVLFEVTPLIRPGAVIGQTVTLIRPPIKAVMHPDPSYGSHRPVVTAGASFAFVQTLR